MANEYENSSRGIVAANLKRLMKEKGVAASDVCRALDIPNATFSDWLNAKTYPRISKLDKLAQYFGVTKSDIVDLHVDKDDPLFPAARVKPALDDDLSDLLEELRNRDDMRMLFKVAKGATRDDVLQAVKIIEALRK